MGELKSPISSRLHDANTFQDLRRFLRLHGALWLQRRIGPMTLGGAAKAHLVLHVWCHDCLHRVDLDPGKQAELHGADMRVPDWASRLICSQCGSHNTDFVVAPNSTGGIGNR